MRLKFVLLLTVMSLAIIQSSCNKSIETDTPLQQNPPVALENMLQCHGQTSWDSTKIHNALIGKWNWEYIKCYWNPEDANSEYYKNLTIEFKYNDTLEVKLNNQITQRSSWNLTRLNDGFFKLSANPIVLQLTGRILFCEDRVLFYDSYTDGCDNYFKKQN